MEDRNDSIIHVTITDSDTDAQEEIVRQINSFGGFVIDIITGSGEELIIRIEKMKKRPDICMFDIRIKDKNGYETLIEIKKRWPEMYPLIFTSVTHKCAVRYMLKKGAAGYLHKDIHFNDLEKALRAIYEKEFYHSELTSEILRHSIPGDKNYVPEITDEEMKFLPYCCTSLVYKEIADKMSMKYRTVKGYRDSLFEKLNIHSRISLSNFAIKMGFSPD